MSATTLTPARRSYGWRHWQDAVREVSIALLIGVLLSFLSGAPSRATLTHNTLTMLAILLAARGMETALSWAIEQSRIPTFFRIVIYVLGGGVALFFSVGQRKFDVFDSLIVAILAATTVGFVLHHNRKRNDRVRASIERLKEHEFAEKELQIAREMQQRLLPPPLIERDGFRVTARTHAAHIVGGDFYDVLRLTDDQTAILAADVSGKGIAASLIMASCKAMIPFLAGSGGAAEVMRQLNARLCEQLQRREFVAMVLVKYDRAAGTAEIVNAGMPDPLLSGRPVVCPGERLPLGAMKAARYESTTIALPRGERLLLFSDGLFEATVDGSPIGYERVEEIAARATGVDALIDEVRAIPGLQIEDDVTVVEVRIS